MFVKGKPSRAPQRDESNSHDIKVYAGYRAVSFDDGNGFPRVIKRACVRPSLGKRTSPAKMTTSRRPKRFILTSAGCAVHFQVRVSCRSLRRRF
jgi:hypothetical protein